MLRTITGSALILGCVLAAAEVPPAANAPFRIDATENVAADFTGAPRLHSFVSAQWDGKWIFIAGRTGGYHGVGQGEIDFPRTTANQNIWVIEPPDNGPAKVYSFPVADLPASLNAVKDQWMSTSLEWAQDKDTLYLLGGYGQTSAGETITFPLISSVNLPALIDGVIHHKDTFSKTIAWTESPLVQSTGGELLRLDDGNFYLIGGHVFMGSYRSFEAADEKESPKASQKYLGEIRKLKFGPGKPGKIDVKLVETFSDPEFARRDLNAGQLIMEDGKTLGAAAWGGVFTKEQLNFTHPIFISTKGAPKVDLTYEQKMSSYSCAKLLLFDPDAAAMYTTLFGGISRWRWTDKTKQFEKAPTVGDKSKQTDYLDGMPWIDEITTLVRKGGAISEVVNADRLPGYLGTNAEFMPAAGLKRIREDANIYDLRQFKGKRVFAGYLFGGIKASPKQFPYTDEAPEYTSGNVPTKPSDVILKVYITAP